jgi:hypothetical protein
VLSSGDQASAAATGAFLEQVRRQFYSSFEGAGFALRPSAKKLVCVCLDSYDQLDRYARTVDGVDASWMGGYYSHRTNSVTIVRIPGAVRASAATSASPSGVNAAYGGPTGEGNLRTLTHELAHQLAFNSGLQREGADYPFWLTEGLATNFEADNSGAYGLFRDDAGYRARLTQLKAEGRLIPLKRFVAARDLPSGGGLTTRDAYVQAWGLFHYLLAHRRGELKRYLSGWSAGRQPPERRFADAFGPLDALEADYLLRVGG